MKLITVLLGFAMMFGCVRAPVSDAPSPLTGTYTYSTFDLGFRLTLRPDGTYRETEAGPLIVLGPAGEIPPDKERDHGRFVVRGDRIILYSESRPRRTLLKVDGPKVLLRETVRGHPLDYIHESR
jgi:hypothetical protein